MKVSILCTVRNGAGFISGTIDSLLNQTMPHFELIFVDDGSTDGTLQIAKNFARVDQRIHVIETGGIGRGKALNLAIQHATGEFIANVDIDDPSHPKRLEMQTAILEERRDIDCLVTDSVLIRGRVQPRWQRENYLLDDPELLSEISIETLLQRNPINHSSLFIRKAVLEEVGGYDEERDSLFDYDLWLRLVSAGKTIYQLNKKLATKRVHADQSFEKRNQLKYLLATRKLKRLYIKQYSNSYKTLALAEMKVVYGLLPQSMRYALKKVYVNTKK